MANYEAKNLVYAESNRNVANATIGIFEGWFPLPLKGLVQPVVRTLIDEDLRKAFGFAPPSKLLMGIVQAGLWARKQFMRVFNIERHPKLITNTLNRTYPGNSYTIENITPSYMKPRSGKANSKFYSQ